MEVKVEYEQRQEHQQWFPRLRYSCRSVKAMEWGLLQKEVTVHGGFRNLFSLGNYSLSPFGPLSSGRYFGI